MFFLTFFLMGSGFGSPIRICWIRIRIKSMRIRNLAANRPETKTPADLLPVQAQVVNGALQGQERQRPGSLLHCSCPDNNSSMCTGTVCFYTDKNQCCASGSGIRDPVPF